MMMHPVSMMHIASLICVVRGCG